MPTKKYILPIKVEIKSDNPDKEIKRIADCIYDSITAMTNKPGYKQRVNLLDLDYSIYIKAENDAFDEL